MKFDVTLLAVRISYLLWSFKTASSVPGLRRAGAALMVAHENLDAADVTEGPLDTHVGPPWMWQQAVALDIDNLDTTFNFNLVSSNTGGIMVKAKRRLRENNATLWLVLDNEDTVGVSDTELFFSGYFRTLLFIP